MIPWAKLKTAPVRRSQPPKRRKAARTRSQPRRPPGQPEHGDQPDECAGDQPRDLAAHRLEEEPVPPGGSPHRAGGGSAADAARLVPAEPADAVVAEDEVEEAVVGGPADVGPVRRRGQLHDGHPPPGRHDEGDPGVDELHDAATELGRPGEQVDEGQHRHEDQCLQHLGDEAEADQRPGQDHPAGPSRLEGPDGGVRGAGEEQGEEGVGVVEPEHQGGHRGEGHDRAGQQRRPRGEPPAHAGVEQSDRGHSLEGLGDQDAPGVHAEQARRDAP